VPILEQRHGLASRQRRASQNSLDIDIGIDTASSAGTAASHLRS
jgi:hypothetical protein